MSQGDRVFVTGVGALTASGFSVEDQWAALMAGQSSLGVIDNADLSSWTHQLGGEIKSLQAAQLLPDRKLIKVISRQDVLGINAAMQAIKHSQLISYRDALAEPSSYNDKTAIFVGSPGNKYYQQYDFLPLLAKAGDDMQAFAAQLFNEVHPMWLLRILPNNVLAYTGITYGFKGVNQNIANHAVGGMQAIIEAMHAIRQGQAERAVVVAYDVGIEPQALFYYEKLGVLSARHLKPFDSQHDGTILAEGAAAIVLESETSIRERGATCYGEILGGLSRSEAAGLFSIEEEGQELTALLVDTLAQAGIHPEQIGLVFAHGNGNPKSDRSEARAIHKTFGEYSVPVTAVKWAMGHTLCASGVLDTVLAVKSLAEQKIPGIASLDHIATACDALNVSQKTRAIQGAKQALIINRGFASMNASLVIKACD